jgi:hypothetical protein
MRPCLLLSCILTLSACDGPKSDPAIAEALSVEGEQKKAAELIEAKRKAEKDAEARARRELDERRRTEIDEVARLPDEMPADLGRACEAVTAAYDEFMKRGSEKDVLTWHDGRRKALGQRRTNCIAAGNLTVAACEAEALQHEFASLAELPRVDAARMVMEHCVEKFGS